MDNFIEQMLHIKAEMTDYTDAGNLPIYLKGNYELHILKVAGTICLLAQPKEAINLSALRKQQQQLKKLSGIECVLFFDYINAYAKTKMLEEGIPFIIKNKQVYMPFLGIVLSSQERQEQPEVNEISFMTQKLLLIAIYEKWEKISLSEAAKALGVTITSAMRCFNELDALGLPLISKREKRYFIWDQDRITLWKLLRPHLRNPVTKEYLLEESLPLKDMRLGGMSALSSYSMLNDNSFKTYAVTRKLAKELKLMDLPCVPKGEVPSQVIQVLQYELPYGNGMAVDPLTAILSIADDEKVDPRVEAAIDEVLEEKMNG